MESKFTFKPCFIRLWNPKRLIRYVVLFVCTIVVVFQLMECFSKLRHPPISTHTRFELNETISYPAVTFCRDPPYNAVALAQFGLTFHPQFTSSWRKFPFEKFSIDDVFFTATYKRKDYFGQYGLNEDPKNIKVVSNLHFNLGRCQTILPRITTDCSWRSCGYSVLLHRESDMSIESVSEMPPGWHMYIHEPRENFTEINMQSSGRVEYIYITPNEEIEIKLSAKHFRKLTSRTYQCTYDNSHSAIQCKESCFWRQIVEKTKCRGPWMFDVNVPLCNNYTSMKALIVQYHDVKSFNKSQCDCFEPCNSDIYSSFVMKRTPFPNQLMPRTQIWLYYTTKMVSVIEERANYDATQFLADIGGSMGFLLGLSVLGLISLIGRVIMVAMNICLGKQRSASISEDTEIEEISQQISSTQEK